LALAVFPVISPPAYPLGNKWENPALTSAMEDGTVVSRPRFTRIRETFTLRWTALPAAEFVLLRSFWKTVVFGSGQEFIWNYPVVDGDEYSGQAFTVRFIAGDVNFELAGNGLYSGELTLQEV
jgi:hypothetical protein